MSNNLINKILGFYTRSPKYKKTLIADNKRLDLNGNVASVILKSDLNKEPTIALNSENKVV